MKRINNFHKSKPIVQNVKTNSVNEGKAPKNLTLSNDISDWNPGVSHEQISEAKGDAPSFQDAMKNVAKGQAAASAPTSYSQEVDRFIGVASGHRRFQQAFSKYNNAQEALVKANNTKEDIESSEEYQEITTAMDGINKELDNLRDVRAQAAKNNDQKLIDKVDKKMAQVTDKNQETIQQYNEFQEDIQNHTRDANQSQRDMDAARLNGEKATRQLAKYGERPDMGDGPKDPPKGDGPKDPPTKGDGPKDPPSKGDNTLVFRPDNGLDYVAPDMTSPIAIIGDQISKKALDGELQIPDQGISPEQAIEDASKEMKSQSAALQDPDKALTPAEAITTVKEFSPELDMHSAARDAGIGFEVVADGAVLQDFTIISRCSDSALLYTKGDLKRKGYPQFWESSTSTRYQNTGLTQVNAPKGHTQLDPLELYTGDYAGPTGLTSC